MTTQTSTLRIVVDSSDATQQAKAFEKQLTSIDESSRRAVGTTNTLTNSVDRLVSQMSSLITASKSLNSTDAFASLNSQVKLLTASQAQLNRSIESAARSAQERSQAFEQQLNRIDTSSRRAVASTDALSDTVKRLVSQMGGFLIVSSAINKMDTYTNLNNRVKLVTDSQIQLNKAVEGTFKVAQATAQEWQTVTMVYQRFADNADKLNLSQEKTISLTDTVAKSIAISGASASSAEAALMQFGQSLASNVLRGEEYNSIAEQAPALLKAIANGLDVDIGKLRAMAGEGKLTGDVVVKALTKSKESVDELFSRTDFTVAQSFTQINNALVKFVGEGGKSSGVAKGLADGLYAVSQNLELILSTAVVAGLGLITKAIASKVVAVQASIVASRAQTVADNENAVSQARLASLELARMRNVRALAVIESDLARREYNSATTRAQRAAATIRLSQAEVALGLATVQTRNATELATIAQNRLNASRAIGSKIMGAVGGYAGIATIAIMGLATAYMALKGDSDEANASLASQIEIVSELSGKYRELTLEKLIVEQDAINEKQKEYQKQLDTSANGILSLAQISEYSSDAQLKQASELISVVKGLRDGSVTTGKALIKMRESGFTDGDIKQASKYFTEFTTAREGISKTTNQLDYLAQQTGIFGTKLEDSNKKIAIQRSNVNALSGDYDSLNKQFKDSIEWLMQQDSVLSMNAKKQGEVRTAIDKYNDGTITATQLTKIFHDILPIDPNVLKKTDDLANKTQNAKNELAKANTELVKIQSNAPKASKGVDQLKSSTDGAAKSQERLNKAQTAFNKSNSDKVFDATFTNTLLKRGYDEEFITAQLETANLARKEGVALTNEMAKATSDRLKLEQKNSAIIDSRNKAQQEQVKAEKAQNKSTGSRLVGVSGNTGRSTGAHLHVQYPKGSGRGGVTAEHMARFQLGGKTLKPSASNSPYGKIRDGKAHGGWDFRAPELTPITTNVAVKSISKLQGKDAGYYSRVTFEDGVVIDLMHQHPSMMGKIGGGSSEGSAKGNNAVYDAYVDEQKNAESEAKRQADARKSLEMEVADAITKINLKLKDDLASVDDAGFSKERADQVKKEFEDRAKSDIEAHQFALRTKVADLANFKKTEMQLLEESFAKERFEILRDRDLSAEQQKESISLLDERLSKEKALLDFSRKERLFDINEQFLGETRASNERYNIEIENIKLTAQESEKAHLLMMRQLQQQTTVNEKAMQARAEWSKVQSEMSGTSEYDAISETQNQRTNASQGLFDSQMAQIDQMALDPLADEKFIAEERVRIHEEMQARLTAIELEANEARYNLNASYGEQMAGNVASMFKTILSECSRSYAVMFAIEKGFAIAQATMSMQVSIAKALEKPFPENLPLIAMAVSQGTQIIGHLSSVSKGFANGGYTGDGGKYDVAGLVHKGEVVFSQNDVARSGGVQAVENARKTGVISTPSPVQQAVQPSVNVNPNFVIVDERANPADYLFSPDGTKAFVKFFKRNRTELGV